METMTAENMYRSADDYTGKRSGKCIPSLVLKAALWLIDKKAYRNRAPSDEISISDPFIFSLEADI